MLGGVVVEKILTIATHTHTHTYEKHGARCSNKCVIVLDVSFDFLVMPRRVTSQRHRQGAAAATAARLPPQRAAL